MKEYSVELPVLMKVTTMVEAETEEEAIRKAIEEIDLIVKSDSNNYEVQEIEAYEKIVQGNFFLGSISEANAELEFDNEDEL